jgi:hypothetical protein
MTKVLMNLDLLEYQREMKEALRQVIRHNFVGGIRQAGRMESHPVQEELLPPPYIMSLCLEAYEGQGDDFIGIVACHDLAIYSMHITILDDRGNLIESGEALPYPEDPNLWEFLPTARVPAGTSVTVHVTAIDYMYGVGRWWKRKTLGEAEL